MIDVVHQIKNKATAYLHIDTLKSYEDAFQYELTNAAEEHFDDCIIIIPILVCVR